MLINKVANQNIQIKNQPAFGSLAGMGKKIASSDSLSKLAGKFEYDKFSMSMTSMLILLYGATIIPRYCNAVDKHDRREILIRDFTSITALLFCAKALSRVFSRAFSKHSGFALNNIPEKHREGGLWEKFKNYFNPSSTEGIDVLNSHELTVKYSKLQNYKNGISDFFKFITYQGGDIRKVLSFEKTVKANADKIVGKDVSTASVKEIENKFAKAKGSKYLKNIYKIFDNSDNAFVRKAKTMNSLFGFISLIILTPGIMIGLEKFNEHLTKKIIAEENAQKNTQATKK